MYDEIEAYNELEYRKLAEAAWDWAEMILLMDPDWFLSGTGSADWKEPDKEPDKKDISEIVVDLLSGYSRVTKYSYYNELERKQLRLVEAILTAREYADRQDLAQSVKKAADNVYAQCCEYGLEATQRAVLAAYKAAGVDRLQWVTMKDDRVCEDCHPLDGKVFDADVCPVPPMHYRCRCYLLPVR